MVIGRAPGHFSLSGESVVYSGPAEWSYWRMVLHQAWLAKAAGGVTAFVIGTELRGLTQVRSAAATYPFVAALVQLAADVKTILGAGTKVTYAADWSEYFGHQPQDGSGDVYFHLDPPWSSVNVDAIGIDLYWPLADWRAAAHLTIGGARSTTPCIAATCFRAGRGSTGLGPPRGAQYFDGAGKPWER